MATGLPSCQDFLIHVEPLAGILPQGTGAAFRFERLRQGLAGQCCGPGVSSSCRKGYKAGGMVMGPSLAGHPDERPHFADLFPQLLPVVAPRPRRHRPAQDEWLVPSWSNHGGDYLIR